MTTEAKTVYFDEPGESNTGETLRLAKARADELGITQVIVATTGGDTALAAVKVFKNFDLVIVTHSTGFDGPDTQSLKDADRKKLEKSGARVLTTTHAFGGVGRAVRFKLNTYELEEIVAYTLRTFGQGAKVCIEITTMAADAGYVKTTKPAIAIAGTGRGADTAMVISPTHVQTFFDLKVHEFICKPW